MPITLPRAAPSALRIPISRERLDTAYASTLWIPAAASTIAMIANTPMMTE